MVQMIWLVPLLPFLGAVVNLFFGKRLGKYSAWLACAVMGAAFATAVSVFLAVQQLAPEQRHVVVHLFDWIKAGGLDVPAALLVDPLSVVMILVVTGVGFLIHVYSIGYMHGDPRYGRFFAYLNLFVFFMLVLVLGDNFLILYVGWEGVGLCSFLLIGFWFEKPEAGPAAKKAFLTTRVGDTLMLIGLALIVVQFGSLSFSDVLGPAAHELSNGISTLIALLLLAGAIGKSAQFPLHVWLPDAMVGPTPVSALIHAATMVTAGVYLLVRTHILFTPEALMVVTVIGLFTAFYAATAAVAQDDLKRVLAYSTISQLGYMFFAVGLGAYGLAIGLLVLHAFYKGLMFLGAGSLMHGLSGETDMRKMGGLIRLMPWTSWFFVIGALALSGIPPLGGFFAKDPIIDYAAETGHFLVWGIALLTAFLSAFYIVRVVGISLSGSFRGPKEPHESPMTMLIPMGVLAFMATFGGLLEIDPHGAIIDFLDPVTGEAAEATSHLFSTPTLMVISVIVALAGVIVAWRMYGSDRTGWIKRQEARPELHAFMENAWYVDKAYAIAIVPLGTAAAHGAAALDRSVVDGAVNGLGRVTTAGAAVLRRLQTGYVRTYALGILLGAAFILFWVLVR